MVLDYGPTHGSLYKFLIKIISEMKNIGSTTKQKNTKSKPGKPEITTDKRDHEVPTVC